MSSIDLNAIGAKHTVWVEAMGWHNKTVLESLALIASEIGEAAAECLGQDVLLLVEVQKEKFAEELADIILRTTDLAQTEGVNLNEEVAKVIVEWKAVSIPECMAEILVEYALWSNTARKVTLEPDFAEGMGKMVARVVNLAELCYIDLNDEVAKKLAKNSQRGTRGRPI